jgi:hypothetical protein
MGGLHLGFGYVKCLLVGSFAVLCNGWKEQKRNENGRKSRDGETKDGSEGSTRARMCAG